MILFANITVKNMVEVLRLKKKFVRFAIKKEKRNDNYSILGNINKKTG